MQVWQSSNANHLTWPRVERVDGPRNWLGSAICNRAPLVLVDSEPLARRVAVVDECLREVSL